MKSCVSFTKRINIKLECKYKYWIDESVCETLKLGEGSTIVRRMTDSIFNATDGFCVRILKNIDFFVKHIFNKKDVKSNIRKCHNNDWGTATVRMSQIFHELDYHPHYFPSNDPSAHETDLARCNLTRARGHINPNEHESWQLRCPAGAVRMTSEDSAPTWGSPPTCDESWPPRPSHVTSWHVPPGWQWSGQTSDTSPGYYLILFPTLEISRAAACRSNYSNPNWSINLINIYICNSVSHYFYE